MSSKNLDSLTIKDFFGIFPEFLESCRATSLLAELEDDDEELPDADEDDNDEDDANDDEVILHDFSVQLEILPF